MKYLLLTLSLGFLLVAVSCGEAADGLDFDSELPLDTNDPIAPSTDDGTCGVGAERCDGNTVQHCDDGMWADWSDCLVSNQICAPVEGVFQCVTPGSNPNDSDSNGTPGDTASDSQADTGTGTGTGVDTGTGTGNGVDTGTGNGVDTGTGTGADTGTGTVTDTGTGTGTDTGTGTVTPPACAGECWSGCFNCVIGSETNLTAPCKVQADACWADPACGAYTDCRNPCLTPYDQACVDACDVNYAAGKAIWDAILICADTTGGCTGCGSGAVDTDPPPPDTDTYPTTCSGDCWSGCFECIIGSETNLTAPCKAQADACWAAPECGAYTACKDPCLSPTYDQACVDACDMTHAAGKALWDAILQCGDTNGCTGCMPAG